MFRIPVFARPLVVAAFLVPSLAAQPPATKTGSPAAAEMAGHRMNHESHAMATNGGQLASPGQAAFGTISEVVRLLEADSATDWTRVDIEALRGHLIDMDEVTLHSTITQQPVPGGFEALVTGTGRTIGSIRRMVTNHARMLDQGGDYTAVVTEVPGGVRLTVTARHAEEARTVARLRGLGVAGLLTEGNHHAPHHLALARGDADPHGR